MVFTKAELLDQLRIMRGGLGAILTKDELDAVMAELDDRRCATCRWAIGFGGRDNEASCERIDQPGALMRTDDPHIAVIVTPDFSCVMHEAKPDLENVTVSRADGVVTIDYNRGVSVVEVFADEMREAKP